MGTLLRPATSLTQHVDAPLSLKLLLAFHAVLNTVLGYHGEQNQYGTLPTTLLRLISICTS